VPFNARVLRVLVGSPSDTAEHRQAVRDAIVEWNDLNAEPHGTVLLPVMWEMSSRPELGGSPQQLLNAQMVDKTDMLVGIFWTRLGTPTDEAASGTVEEINRMRERGAQILVYFSNQPVVPATLDTRQLDAVRAYKESLQSEGLYREFATTAELVGALQRDITRALPSVTSATAPDEKPELVREPVGKNERLAVYRSEFRGLVARFRISWAGSIGDPTAIDELRRAMSALANGLTDFLGALAELSETASTSALYSRIGEIAMKATQLSRFQLFMDGGTSWREFQTEGEEVLIALMEISDDEWSL
jgi:hypothetical protein